MPAPSPSRKRKSPCSIGLLFVTSLLALVTQATKLLLKVPEMHSINLKILLPPAVPVVNYALQWTVESDMQQIVHLMLFSLVGLCIGPWTHGRVMMIFVLAAAHAVVAANITHELTHIKLEFKLHNSFALIELMICGLYLFSFLTAITRTPSVDDIHIMQNRVTAAAKMCMAAAEAREKKLQKKLEAARRLQEDIQKEQGEQMAVRQNLRELAEEADEQRKVLEVGAASVGKVKKEA